jgi:hypothetical protein
LRRRPQFVAHPRVEDAQSATSANSGQSAVRRLRIMAA